MTRALPLLLVAACATAERREATAVVGAYRRALDHDDSAAAYALLSEQVRRRVSRADFDARWKATRLERAEQARALAQPARLALEASVSAEGRRLVLRDEGNGWRIALAMPLEETTSPEAVLAALVRAVEQRDYGAFQQLLTDSCRDRLDQAIERRLDMLKEALLRPAEVRGDRVIYQHSAAFRIVLRKEGDSWRVEDID